ncbi:MAG: 23S rRNA (adenine(2030)-N(6))-methyltransferase RlmJ, partial [Gammaproteobacteria bacterium]
VVLIDPSYEMKSDYKTVITAVDDAVRRWATGVFLVWYPLLDRTVADRLLRRIEATGIRKVLYAEFGLRDAALGTGLWGSGLVIVNPPYQLDKQLKRLLPWLKRVLKARPSAPSNVRWITPE